MPVSKLAVELVTGEKTTVEDAIQSQIARTLYKAKRNPQAQYQNSHVMQQK
jgi:hypothetical protein